MSQSSKAVMVALLLAACSGRGHVSPSTRAPNPERVRLAPMSLATKTAVAAYLAGPGEAYTEFRAVSEPLLQLRPADPAPPEAVRMCADLVARLAAGPDTGQLLTVARQVPDATMAVLAVDERAARGNLLTTCVAGHIPQSLVRSATSANALVNRRLRELR